MTGSRSDTDAVSVAVAASERYALPLAVMVRSALENSSEPLQLFLLADGIAGATRERLLRSWEGHDLSVHWVDVIPPEVLEHVQLTGYAGGPTTYFRLLISDLLPASLDRVVFLDADLIVSGDLAELWRLTPEPGHILRATPIRPALSVMLGFEPPEVENADQRPAFNAGVMMIDLVTWRREEIGPRALELAVRYRDRFHQWDQSALNCVVVDRWTPLPLAWNHRPDELGFPSWTSAGYTPAEVTEAETNPKITHFAGSVKPWDERAEPGQAAQFLDVVSRTAWTGWRRPELHGRAKLHWVLIGLPHRRVERLLEIIGKCRQSGVPADRFTRMLARQLLLRPWLVVSIPVTSGLRRLQPSRLIAPRPRRLLRRRARRAAAVR